MRYKVHTTWWSEAEDFQKLMEEINDIESRLETTEQSTYEEINDERFEVIKE